MRTLLIIPAILLLALPAQALAIAGQDTRFGFLLGTPSLTADATDECTNTAKARFDFVLGMPAVVYDATATCAVTSTEPGPAILYIKDGELRIKDGELRIKE